MKKMMILGAGVYQAPLIRAAKNMGLYTIVASVPGRYPGFALADKVYRVNTVDREAVLAAARAENIAGICTSGTDTAVATIGYVCEKLGLSGLSAQAAAKATDKALMKEAFLEKGVSTARFFKVSSLEEAKAAACKLGYPVVVKRVDSSGSRGITVVPGEEGMEQAWQEALECSWKEYALVEECLKGTEIGVDGVVQHRKLVFLAPHEKQVYKSSRITIPAGHAFPYHCSERLQREIARQMQLAVDALGLDNCSVNADVFVDGERVFIIELGGRTGATCIPELISTYYGFDFYEKILQNALGIELSFALAREGTPCMARLLMSPVNGTITRIDEAGLERVRREGAVVALDYPVGQPVEAMANGTNRIGHVIVRTDQKEELEDTLSRVYSCIDLDGVSLERLWKK